VTKTRRRPSSIEDLPPSAASPRYIESSAVVAALLEGDAEAMAQIAELGVRVASALTFTESTRALLRARVIRRITPAEERTALRKLRALEAKSTVFAMSPDVLTRAGRPFPVEPVRTLDAIHLATIESLGETPQLVTVVTRDQRIARNARALGYAIAP
jgi:predicted nucleic acid-binding protein